jgi:tRNA(Ile)-lysidine synthase
MVLLDAAAATVERDRLIVGTFDHGTGPAARCAAELVEREALRLGLRSVAGRADVAPVGEAALRDARWAFLHRIAGTEAARVATAHTQDDQVETVLMRILRGAGTRGLAGLYAETDILRPLLRTTRRELVSYARARGLTWIEDPSNATPQYLRNRVRHDLLPALRRVRPTIDDELLAFARKAARWRADVEACIASDSIRRLSDGSGIDVSAASFSPGPTASASAARLLWPAIAASIGLVLDRRAIERLAAFTPSAQVGQRVQLSGGWEVIRGRDDFQLRSAQSTELRATAATIALSDSTRYGDWSFTLGSDRLEESDLGTDVWSAWLPADRPLTVRPWHAGDAMVCRSGGSPRKVKRLLSDAGVTGHHRTGWPVVLAGDQIVWIPGVRRTEAATARPGRPGLPFVCEYIHR